MIAALSARRVRRFRRIAGLLVAIGCIATLAMAIGIAMPANEWSTGERFDNGFPVTSRAGIPATTISVTDNPVTTGRIWIDTDAACGAGARVDPDDCLAILHLAGDAGTEITGLSSVFGNAALATTDATTRRLVTMLADPDRKPLAVYRGAASPHASDGTAPNSMANATAYATRAIIEALSAGPLTIVALGPLTNIAAALASRPDLHDNVEKIVAVMGRRRGHVFHPSEGNGLGMLLGHGPVFRDFNVAKDPEAVASILTTDIPLVLVPYEAARDIEIDATALARLTVRGPAHRLVANASRPWLAYWNDNIGRKGFYPFDLLAAMYITGPQRFDCVGVTARLGRDETLSFPFNRARALTVAASEGTPTDRLVVYCHTVQAQQAPLLAGLTTGNAR